MCHTSIQERVGVRERTTPRRFTSVRASGETKITMAFPPEGCHTHKDGYHTSIIAAEQEGSEALVPHLIIYSNASANARCARSFYVAESNARFAERLILAHLLRRRPQHDRLVV